VRTSNPKEKPPSITAQPSFPQLFTAHSETPKLREFTACLPEIPNPVAICQHRMGVQYFRHVLSKKTAIESGKYSNQGNPGIT
jgi:hypothetical protein